MEISAVGIPVVKFLRVWLVKKMIQRFVEYVGSAAAFESQREKQILEEGLHSGDKRGNQLVFNIYLVRPIGCNPFVHKSWTVSSEIDGPGAAARAVHAERE